MTSKSRSDYLLSYTIDQANNIPYESGFRRVYAVVVDKRGRILSEGMNSYTQSHPYQARFANRVGLPDKIYLHAEISSLVKIRVGIPFAIYIARVDSKGNPKLAAPCPICYAAIIASGILDENIYHT